MSKANAISYDDLQKFSDHNVCNEVRDSCFAVVAGLHIDRVSFLGGFGSNHAKHTVSFYLASDCHNLTDGHRDFTDKRAFVGGFVFDTLEEANESFNFHITCRVCDPDAHDIDLSDNYGVRAYV